MANNEYVTKKDLEGLKQELLGKLATKEELNAVKNDLQQVNELLGGSIEIVARQVANNTIEISNLRQDVNEIKSDISGLKQDIKEMKERIDLFEIKTDRHFHTLLEAIHGIATKMDDAAMERYEMKRAIRKLEEQAA